jgi:hypothetical protein
MAERRAGKQFSFRLPEELIERVEACTAGIQATGLDVTRADVVRLLLKHALEATQCRLDLLLKGHGPRVAPRRRGSRAPS